MNGLQVYLNFNGNCKEALQFYHAELGGSLSIQVLADQKESSQFPDELREKVVQGKLVLDTWTIFGTDLLDEKIYIKGTNISLLLSFQSKAELLERYQSMSKHGTQHAPPHSPDEQTCVGSFTDPYGVQWILQYHNFVL
ncbi:MAG: VOC family protein [Chitinophagaceae bacterium]|nr:VOC family protein [Chitinophagaceae bacterium]